MKWRSLFFLSTCLLMQNWVFGQKTEKGSITVKKTPEGFGFTCSGGNWGEKGSALLTLPYKEHSRDYECNVTGSIKTLTVKFRTCENCIELNAISLSAVIVGNILATFLIAFAVYSITGQSKGESFSGNKASDRMTLITNGERETYQKLNPGQSSEYSRLEKKK